MLDPFPPVSVPVVAGMALTAADSVGGEFGHPRRGRSECCGAERIAIGPAG